jgi:4-hydroxy-2-oxoheptanedioate aldolase
MPNSGPNSGLDSKPDSPISRNRFKQAIAKGERQVGVWSALASPIVAEILAGAGFDWLVIDGEHAPNDISTLVPQLQAARGSTAEPVFRVPWNDMVVMKRALDVGARTLIVPFVQNAEEARRAAAAMLYPPHGVRGVAVVVRGSDFGRVPNYLQNAHLDTCLLVQLETRAALNEIEAIAKVEGVDGIFIGPSDLAADMGHLGNNKHPDVQAAIKDAADRIRAAGKPAGTLVANVEDAERMFDWGFNFVAAAIDVALLARNAEAVAARLKKTVSSC